jgi:hypothetical protein
MKQQRMRRLSADEEAQAENIAAKIGMTSTRVKFFMALPDALSGWSKRSLARVLRHRADQSGAQLAPIVETLVGEIRGLKNELAALRRDVDAKTYKGVWQEGGYEKGNLITHGGCMWVALEDTDDKPGTSGAWQLAVKRGRDGRDAR